MRPPSGPIEVHAPAQADSLRILRAVVASVGARLDLPIDAIEELRTAVDEAATILLRSTDGSITLHLRLEVDGPSLVFRLDVDGAAPTWPPPDAARSWPWLVITGLTDGAVFEDGGPPSISFRARPTSSGGP